jgi:hypothetical protein
MGCKPRTVRERRVRETKAGEERPQEFRPTGKSGLKCDGPWVVVRRGGKGERQKERQDRASEIEGGSCRITKERATDKSMQMTAGEKKADRSEIERSGPRTVIIAVRQIDTKLLRKSSR